MEDQEFILPRQRNTSEFFHLHRLLHNSTWFPYTAHSPGRTSPYEDPDSLEYYGRSHPCSYKPLWTCCPPVTPCRGSYAFEIAAIYAYNSTSTYAPLVCHLLSSIESIKHNYAIHSACLYCENHGNTHHEETENSADDLIVDEESESEAEEDHMENSLQSIFMFHLSNAHALLLLNYYHLPTHPSERLLGTVSTISFIKQR